MLYCLVARLSAFAACLSLPLLAQDSPSKPPVRRPHAMVVSIQHDATDAGVAILKQGGNAVDAAVAVGFALAVVYPQAGNIGGGGFLLLRPGHATGAKKLGDGKPHFLDFREKAPAAAARDMYLGKDGNVVKGLSTQGYLASGVPGTVAGLAYAEQHFGRLGLKAVMQPAIRLARDGWVGTEPEIAAWRTKQMAPYPESRRVFQRDGDFYKAGEVIRQPELAATLERIAADASEFYTGRMARQIADTMQEGGGLITTADLAAYRVKDRAPLVGHYRGYDILTSPPPSSGGIVLLEILNILSGYDLPKVGADRSPEQVHLIVEAFRRAYMDRGDYLGDPDFTAMPLQQMADPAYAAAWRRTIDPVNATPSASLVRPAGFMPPAPSAERHESPQTTHFSVVDADGNAVSMTYTLNFFFGSGATIKGLGFVMNDEMDDFTSKPGTPNGFGLVQGPANAIAPGKRPLSSMTPTIVTKNGRLRLVLGTPGGSTIPTTVANDLISMVDNGLNVQQAADAPRFHHQYLPDVLELEKRYPVETIQVLATRGYMLRRSGEFDEKNPGLWGDSELIAVDPATGDLLGGHDTRRAFGKADGY